MSVLINTNSAATLASNNLAASNSLLQRSLNRLSSGSKIVNPADDAGGLAVSMKLSAAARRQGAAMSNLGNSVSYLQSQDGVLKTIGKVLDRIGELKTLATDPTKNSDDIANYNAEFSALKSELTSLASEKFNGINLFGSTGLSVGTTESGDTSITMDGVNLMGGVTGNWNSVAMGASDWTLGGGAADLSNEISFHTTGTYTSNQNITGGFTLSFDVSTLGSTGYNPTTISAGGATLNLSSVLPDANDHSIVIIDDGTTASISVDGGAATSMASLIGGSGSPLAFNSDATNFPSDDMHISNLTLNNTGGGSSDVSSVSSAGSLTALNLSSITGAIQEIATFRADNGALQSRIGYATEVLTTNKANLEAANSRIIDVDVAEESTALARYNVLVQAGTSMLAQANQSAQTALRLLG
jgi:flagellin-like hook-associated protein FlgL